MSEDKQRRRCIVQGLLALGGWHFSALIGEAQAQPAQTRTLLVVGDSLSAEYGLARGSGWVALLQQRVQARQLPWRVVNASISGETSSGGRSRFEALLRQHQPKLVLLELGANDALRGLPLSSTQDNLRHMLQSTQAAGAKAVLLGMQVPPNYGKRYAEEFRTLFETLARSERVAFVPFFLRGVADAPDPLALFQADRIHPNAQAQPLLLDNVWPVVQPLLR